MKGNYKKKREREEKKCSKAANNPWRGVFEGSDQGLFAAAVHEGEKWGKTKENKMRVGRVVDYAGDCMYGQANV